MFDSLKSIVGGIAPTIATALGGPLAGGAVKMLTGALGLDDGAKEADIRDAVLAADPKTIAALKQAEMDYQAKMKALDIDLERIAAEDRDSARRREAVTGDKTTRNLAYLFTMSYFAFMVIVLLIEVPPAVVGTMNILVGILSTAMAGIIGYYFGSSASSREKTNILGKKR